MPRPLTISASPAGADTPAAGGGETATPPSSAGTTASARPGRPPPAAATGPALTTKALLRAAAVGWLAAGRGGAAASVAGGRAQLVPASGPWPGPAAPGQRSPRATGVTTGGDDGPGPRRPSGPEPWLGGAPWPEPDPPAGILGRVRAWSAWLLAPPPAARKVAGLEGVGGGALATRALLSDADAGGATSAYQNPLCVGRPNIAEGVWVMKRIGLIEFCNVHSRRGDNMVRQLQIVDRVHPELPDFGPVLLCTRDRGHECIDAMDNKSALGAVSMAFSRSRGHREGGEAHSVVLVPDTTFWGWEEVGIDDFELTASRMRQAGRRPPKKDVAGWVGNPKTNPIRPKLLNMSLEHPQEVEAVAMDWLEAKDGRHLGWTAGGRSLPDQVAEWAYLVDVRGHGYSFRVKLFFHSNRPILWQAQPWEEFYYHQLEPFVHYVPLSETISDLPNKVLWLRQNPDQAAAIATNAQRFARRHLTREAAIRRWVVAIGEVRDIERRAAAQTSDNPKP